MSRFDQRNQKVETQINVAGNLVQKITQVITRDPSEEQTRRDLAILRRTVGNDWIKGVLETSLHRACQLELGLEPRPDAVDHPWQMVIDRPDEPPQPLPAGTKVSDIFADNRLLLILGEPGSGKTITLLELARDLLAELEDDVEFSQPVPVIFNLSTWSNKRQPLLDWLVEEFRTKYRIPKRISRVWLETRRILPLLDGLDEVARDSRTACVNAINRFVADYGGQGMVVCSRAQDYEALNQQLQLDRAVYIQPLSAAQIDRYLAKAGAGLSHLRTAMQSDPALQSLAQTPLMLNVMSIAYRDLSREKPTEPTAIDLEAQRHLLFERFIKQMLGRRRNETGFADEQVDRTLTWLAQNMRTNNQTLFLAEQLQPRWLGTTALWQYLFVSRLLGGLVIGLSGGLFFAHQTWFWLGLAHGLAGGLVMIILDLIRAGGRLRLPALGWRLPDILRPMAYLLLLWLLFTILFVPISTLFFFGDTSPLGAQFALLSGILLSLLNGLFYGLIFSLIYGVRSRGRSLLDDDIQLVESLGWSWENAITAGIIRGVLFGVLTGAVLGGLLGFIATIIGAFNPAGEFQDASLAVRLAIAAVAGPIFGLLIGLLMGFIGGLYGGVVGIFYGGLTPKIALSKTKFNEGVRLSLRNGAMGGFISFFNGGLIGLLIWGGLLAGLSSEFAVTPALYQGCGSLCSGLSAGLLGFLWFGGLDILYHYLLRLSLIIHGDTPIRFASFLDQCTDRIFLQKVGGGYRFIHRLLQEHFTGRDFTYEPDSK